MTGTKAVSVVIATIGRPELRRAVASALGQTYPPAEIIVVTDRPDAPIRHQLDGLPDAIPIRHLDSGGRGGNVARNLGIAAARGDFVALLDDDDIWFAHKVERQLAWHQALPAADQARAIIVCGHVDEASGHVAPSDPYRSGPIENWLFDLSLAHPTERRTVQTSGMFLPAELARAVRFDEQLTVHQDWDFVVRAVREHGATVVHRRDPLYWFSAAATGKVSRHGRLEAEQAWAADALAPGSKQLSYYYLTITAPRALQRGEYREALAAVRRGLRGRVSARGVAFLIGACLREMVGRARGGGRAGR